MSLKIIDSHIHFWDPALFRYSWMKDAPELNKKFNHIDFNRHSNGINIEKLVFVQAELFDLVNLFVSALNQI